MHRSAAIAPFCRSLPIAAALLFLTFVPGPAGAQQPKAADRADTMTWRQGFLDHIQRMRVYLDQTQNVQAAPRSDSSLELNNNESGVLGSHRPGGVVLIPDDPFFQPLGSNGRSCVTCHQPQDAWSVSALLARDRFALSGGLDPLFRRIDGATCPTAKVDTLEQRARAFKLLTEKGLFRIGLPLPAPPALQFKISALRDPYRCSSNPITGLTSPTTGVLSVYRRPLPSTNLGFQNTIMWDGREPNLANQAVDATLGHSQAKTAPTAEETARIVAFESGLFTAQTADREAGELDDVGAKGGPIVLSKQFEESPSTASSRSGDFDLYGSWLGLSGNDNETLKRKSIARGEQIFNNVPIQITGVGGINDPVNLPEVTGTCSACHDVPNVGSHSVKDLFDIGISNGRASRNPGLDIKGLPTFTLECTSGPLAGKLFETTDPGRALITGQCEDIGKFKVPSLRGLAARAPYFHNGAAVTLSDVVTFYDRRFSIGLTRGQKQDLINFLKSL